jgi:glycosyltransferase involved in cell wall biosynthesis
MIIVYEPVCLNGEHAMFNAGIIAAATLIAKNRKVTFIADASHLPHVLNCLDKVVAEHVQWQPIEIAPRHTRSLLHRAPIEWRNFCNVWRIAHSSNATAIISTGITEAGILATKFRLNFSQKKLPVLMIFHGILPEFLYSAKRRSLLGVGNARNLRLIVLGEYIHRNVAALIPNAHGFLCHITHPYPFDGAPESIPLKSSESDSSSFGFLGIGNQKKGYPLFLELVKKTTYDIPAPKYYHVGRVAEDCQALLNEYESVNALNKLHRPEENERLSTSEFRNQLSLVDYIILPYDEEHYKFTCSGAALDSLYGLKPIIGLRTSHLEELFSILGDIGYICDDFDQLISTVRELSKNPNSKRYKQQCQNLLTGRRYFGSESVAMELSGILSAV